MVENRTVFYSSSLKSRSTFIFFLCLSGNTHRETSRVCESERGKNACVQKWNRTPFFRRIRSQFASRKKKKISAEEITFSRFVENQQCIFNSEVDNTPRGKKKNAFRDCINFENGRNIGARIEIAAADAGKSHGQAGDHHDLDLGTLFSGRRSSWESVSQDRGLRRFGRGGREERSGESGQGSFRTRDSGRTKTYPAPLGGGAGRGLQVTEEARRRR